MTILAIHAGRIATSFAVIRGRMVVVVVVEHPAFPPGIASDVRGELTSLAKGSCKS
jgi:hypothetical protein